MPTRSHVHEEIFPVSPAELFSILLTPSAIRSWWSASRAIVVPERGGIWAATWGDSENDPDYATAATIRELDPPRRVVLADYRYRAKGGPLPFRADFVTEFLVSEHPEGAALRVTQDGFPAASIADEFYAGCERGWRDTFAGIRRHLEGRGAPWAPEPTPLLYGELAAWWPLVSPPEEYAEEAERFRRALVEACSAPPRTLLELGSGGGHTASHLKQWFEMTLVDIAPAMLAVSRELNFDCEHQQGDMRTLRLGRTFDAVLVHDAINHMRSAAELAQVIGTAYRHLAPGGAALFAPDHTRESFEPGVDHGGCDRDGRSLRFFEWTWDPDPADTEVRAEMVYLFREGTGEVRCRHDTHRYGLFARGEWLKLLREAGFEASAIAGESGETGESAPLIFLGRREL